MGVSENVSCGVQFFSAMCEGAQRFVGRNFGIALSFRQESKKFCAEGISRFD
ncbi:hypothetical protein TC41_1013 [Alicyclobacillus acidocaldarius subsp. acidocaldarius Tc-4-1]|uniref:Uncharacterized protein n=1 Tax=Alicyclobacillus acidocaldarius (strain Tc-4-1) TaxID=1048834 RepID=F8IFZ5_ALIAT|nr:hypothetical protein TC41_1013 [Alicyclobacillus acidocaldarius subsp. acidocaldarius Tc-4-1]